MNEPLSPEINPPDSRPDVARDRERIVALEVSLQSLRNVLQVTMGALILLIAAVNVYLWHQVGIVHRQGAELRQNAEQLSRAVDDYQTNSVPLMQDFSRDLLQLARTDTNVAAIVAKYPLPRPQVAETNRTGRLSPPATLGPR